MSPTVTRHRDGDTITLAVAGDVDLAARDVLATAVGAALDENPSVIAVDLAEVTFLDSSGIGALIRGRNLADERHIVFYTVGANGLVRQVLEMTGVWEHLTR
jgi:anti-sigma B factor antagonist